MNTVKRGWYSEEEARHWVAESGAEESDDSAAEGDTQPLKRAKAHSGMRD